MRLFGYTINKAPYDGTFASSVTDVVKGGETVKSFYHFGRIRAVIWTLSHAFGTR